MHGIAYAGCRKWHSDFGDFFGGVDAGPSVWLQLIQLRFQVTAEGVQLNAFSSTARGYFIQEDRPKLFR
eukprot:352738-Chlamydomonas_euryale.AAC.3